MTHFKKQTLISEHNLARWLVDQGDPRTRGRLSEAAEQQWHGARRLLHWYTKRGPFFHVHLSILECLKNTSPAIDPAMIPPSIIHELGSIEVRTPEGSKVPPFFLGYDESVCALSADNSDGKMDYGSAIYVNFQDGADAYSLNALFGRIPNYDTRYEMLATVFRVGIGIMLLAADPKYCEPILLAKDRKRLLDEEGRQRAIQRAVRRGVVGFDIGRHVEISPHFRRPHFAIRWTEKNRSVPRLVPVRGAIVNRSKMKEIPTGYEIPENPECFTF